MVYLQLITALAIIKSVTLEIWYLHFFFFCHRSLEEIIKYNSTYFSNLARQYTRPLVLRFIIEAKLILIIVNKCICINYLNGRHLRLICTKHNKILKTHSLRIYAVTALQSLVPFVAQKAGFLLRIGCR